jgi:RNA polymerase sigma-70 factor (ECF subfamily)
MIGEPFRHQSQVVELEDLVQDVFVQVYRSLGGFRGHSKISTWIYRIAVNVVLMHRRSLRARPMFYSADDIDAPISPDPIPDEEATRHANVDALYRLLSQVTEKKRTVYILHEIEGLSAAEIAEIVGAPVLTVRTRLFYARREVTALLRDDPHLSVVLKELDTEAARTARRESPFQVVGAQEPPALPNGAVTQEAVTSATRLRSLKEDPGENLATAPKSASSRSREKRS